MYTCTWLNVRNVIDPIKLVSFVINRGCGPEKDHVYLQLSHLPPEVRERGRERMYQYHPLLGAVYQTAWYIGNCSDICWSRCYQGANSCPAHGSLQYGRSPHQLQRRGNVWHTHWLYYILWKHCNTSLGVCVCVCVCVCSDTEYDSLLSPHHMYIVQYQPLLLTLHIQTCAQNVFTLGVWMHGETCVWSCSQSEAITNASGTCSDVLGTYHIVLKWICTCTCTCTSCTGLPLYSCWCTCRVVRTILSRVSMQLVSQPVHQSTVPIDWGPTPCWTWWCLAVPVPWLSESYTNQESLYLILKKCVWMNEWLLTYIRTCTCTQSIYRTACMLLNIVLKLSPQHSMYMYVHIHVTRKMSHLLMGGVISGWSFKKEVH